MNTQAAASSASHYEILVSLKDSKGNSWCIERMPSPVTDPMVVSFRKWNGRRNLLNKYASWSGTGWDAGRYVPKPPIVPARLLGQVEAVLRGEAQP